MENRPVCTHNFSGATNAAPQKGRGTIHGKTKRLSHEGVSQSMRLKRSGTDGDSVHAAGWCQDSAQKQGKGLRGDLWHHNCVPHPHSRVTCSRHRKLGLTQAAADSNLNLPIAMGMGWEKTFLQPPHKRTPWGWGTRKAFWCLPNSSAVLKSPPLTAQFTHKVGRWGGCEDRKPRGNMTLTRRPTPQTLGEAESSCLLGSALSPWADGGNSKQCPFTTTNALHIRASGH